MPEICRATLIRLTLHTYISCNSDLPLELLSIGTRFEAVFWLSEIFDSFITMSKSQVETGGDF